MSPFQVPTIAVGIARTVVAGKVRSRARFAKSHCHGPRRHVDRLLAVGPRWRRPCVVCRRVAPSLDLSRRGPPQPPRLAVGLTILADRSAPPYVRSRRRRVSRFRRVAPSLDLSRRGPPRPPRLSVGLTILRIVRHHPTSGLRCCRVRHFRGVVDGFAPRTRRRWFTMGATIPDPRISRQAAVCNVAWFKSTPFRWLQRLHESPKIAGCARVQPLASCCNL